MYNLLMTAESGAWQRPTWTIPSGRLFEHTHDAIKARFVSMDDRAIADLMGLPALFAYERYNREPARVGRITSIQRRASEIAISWSPDPQVAPIPPEVLETLLTELDIGKYEVNRTHWAVKDVDLGHVLQFSGLAATPVFPAQPAPPKVFISYKWGSPERNQWVAGLAATLRQNGIEAILDQWHLRVGQDMAAFMASNLRDCDRVVIIYTEDYVGRIEGGTTGGVAYEHMLITGELMQQVGTLKFVPVVRQDTNPPRLPVEMRGRWHVNLADGPTYQNQLELLLRELHNVPRPIPPLGQNPFQM